MTHTLEIPLTTGASPPLTLEVDIYTEPPDPHAIGPSVDDWRVVDRDGNEVGLPEWICDALEGLVLTAAIPELRDALRTLGRRAG